MLLDADKSAPQKVYVSRPWRGSETLLYVVIGVGVIYVIASLYLMHDTEDASDGHGEEAANP